MPGQGGTREPDDPMSQIVRVLEEAGYTSVVATNSDHVFHRYVRHGERLALTVSLIGLTGPKRTALGEGWFFTTRHSWYSADEVVATMDFRILKFRPGPGAGTTPVMRPVISPDTAFFWDGMRARELRIQSCLDCGALRHPPGPGCMACGSANAGYVVAAGSGQVFSYVVHHHPPIPGKKLPLVIALTELDEGVRVLAEMIGVSPGEVSIGMPVRIDYLRIDDDLTLPAWRPAGAGAAATGALATELPPMTVDVTATFVVASALATRDFTPVHHDRDLAVANGSKDIFLNILTDTGLVQRFVSSWAGPQSLLRAIWLRLGVPCYAGDSLTFSGRVATHTPLAEADRYELSVTGRCGLGEHIIATAVVEIPRSAA
jgi:uncharacterized OB-fold protein